MEISVGFPQDVKKGQLVAIDIEMFGQDKKTMHRPNGIFACISVLVDGQNTIYQIYDERDIKKMLSAIKNGTWVFHNSLYDLRHLRRYAEIKPRFIWDTMLVDQVAFGGLYDSYSLASLARRWLSELVSKEVREEFAASTSMTDEMKTYAGNDVILTLKVALAQQKYLKETNAWNAYVTVDEPVIFPTLDMQPVKVNVDAWRRAAIEFDETGRAIEQEIGVNVYSPAQVKKGAASQGLRLLDTQASTLEEYPDHPFISKVLEARTYRKASSTYGTKWLECVEDGDLVYASWHVIGTETGRRSCSSPNLQQIPARKLPIYREFFVPRYHRFILDDVSAQEPRILAYHSQDPALLEILQSGGDVHQMVADAIGRDRSVGKVINLATSYGMTAKGLAKKLKVSEVEANGLLSLYFSRFRGVFSYISSQRAAARRVGYVTSVSGRPIHLNLHNYQWENNAINAPIQGGAADFTKTWERLIWEGCQAEGIPYSVWGLIHDEIDLDPQKEYYQKTKDIVEDAFQQTASRLFPGVPFEHEMKTGKSWAAKKLDTDEEEVQNE